MDISKLEKRFDKGKLTIKDIASWIKGSGPREVHEMVCEIWDVKTKMPKINPTTVGIEFRSDENEIYIGVKDVNIFGMDIKKIGEHQSLDYFLKTSLAEEETHYISCLLEPSNYKRQDILGKMGVEKRKRLEFLQSVSLGSQLEAIGYVGRKTVADILDVLNYEDIETKMFEFGLDETNKIVSKNLNKETFDLVYNNPYPKKRQKAYDILNTMFQTMVLKTISGTGQFSLGNAFEKEYSNSLPELARKKLEPTEKYSDKYLEFVGTNYPNFMNFLDDLLIY